MDTSYPATGSAFATGEFVVGDVDASSAGFGLFGVKYPTEEFIACERRDILPSSEHGCVGKQGFTKVVWYGMDCSLQDFDFCHTTSIDYSFVSRCFVNNWQTLNWYVECFC